MESPESWNMLTASLAVCNLDSPATAWAFLVRQGLVRNTPSDCDAFVDFVRQEIERGPITGPSVAWRVAGALESAGIALAAGETPDPWGKISQERLARVSGDASHEKDEGNA